MRIIIILGIIFLGFGVSEASWYVVDANNKVIVKCEYEPDTKDLKSRNEFAVFSNQDIPLSEAVYHNGKIIRHIKTASEILEEKIKRKKEQKKF